MIGAHRLHALFSFALFSFPDGALQRPIRFNIPPPRNRYRTASPFARHAACCMAAWQHGSMAAWQHGSMAACTAAEEQQVVEKVECAFLLRIATDLHQVGLFFWSDVDTFFVASDRGLFCDCGAQRWTRLETDLKF